MLFCCFFTNTPENEFDKIKKISYNQKVHIVTVKNIFEEERMGKVIATCISEVKGVAKRNVHSVRLLQEFGIEKDAHAGKWHRQVSLLSFDKIEAFRAKGAKVVDGDFGENLVVEGIDFSALPVGTRLACQDVVLEITQIGKECHHGCQIFQTMGDCIMPREGVFARVIKGGTIQEGDEMKIISV